MVSHSNESYPAKTSSLYSLLDQKAYWAVATEQKAKRMMNEKMKRESLRGSLSVWNFATRLSREGARAHLFLMIIVATFASRIVGSYGAPVELLVNGSFADGGKGWTTQGGATIQGNQAMISHDGEVYQIVDRKDLSFYLELSYELRASLYNPTSFAGSSVIYYFTDQAGRNNEIKVIAHEVRATESQTYSGNVKVDLFSVFRSTYGSPEALRLLKVRISLKLTFEGLPLGGSPSIAAFKNVSLKRFNPPKFTFNERHDELDDHTDLALSITNTGDFAASNVDVKLDFPSSLSVVSEKIAFQKPTLEVGADWQVSWKLTSSSPGKQQYMVTIMVKADRIDTQIPVVLFVNGPHQSRTTQTAATGSESDRTDTGTLLVASGAFVAILVALASLVVSRKRKISAKIPGVEEEVAKAKVEPPKADLKAEEKKEDRKRYVERLEKLRTQRKISEKVYERLKKKFEDEAEVSEDG